MRSSRSNNRAAAEPSKTQQNWAKNISKKTGISLPEQFTYEAYFEYISRNKDAEDDPGYRFNDPNYGEAMMTISLKRLPEDCTECPFFADYYEDESFFGDGHYNECIFGGDSCGCVVERPQNCPFKKKEK